MKIARLALLVLLFTSAMASAATPRFTGDRARAADLWKHFEAWLVAYEAHDLDKVMAFIDKDVIFSAETLRDADYEALKAVYTRDFRIEKPGSRWVAVPEEIFADGKIAILRGYWELHVPDGKGGVVVRERNRGMDVFRKTRGGWKLFRSVNYPDRLQP